jgi:hypothetical protein
MYVRCVSLYKFTPILKKAVPINLERSEYIETRDREWRMTRFFKKKLGWDFFFEIQLAAFLYHYIVHEFLNLDLLTALAPMHL